MWKEQLQASYLDAKPLQWTLSLPIGVALSQIAIVKTGEFLLQMAANKDRTLSKFLMW